jgi:hypothetical protein
MLDARPDALDDPGAFDPGRERQRLRIEAGAVIDVDEVEPDRVLAESDLAGAGLADLDRLPLQDLGAARLMDSDRVGQQPVL